MRLTPVLNIPPVFHFWKDFGAGKKRRIPFYQIWKKRWRLDVGRREIRDYTLRADQLPAGSRVLDAQDFMTCHIDSLPDDIIEAKNKRIIYDHPWPFNVKIDDYKDRTPYYSYKIENRFFVPREDGLVLTNTVLMEDQMKAKPPIEPTEDHLAVVRRQYKWATQGDSILIKLPRVREFPKMNKKLPRVFGSSEERKEVHVLSSLADISQTILAQHYSKNKDCDEQLNELINRRSLAFPHCATPINRQSEILVLDLCLDTLSLSKSPIKPLNSNPSQTRDIAPVDISPRTWRSLIEKNRDYPNNWTFTLPRRAFPHTVQIGSRIKRFQREEDEMLARSLVHAYGLTTQYARFRALENQETDESNRSTLVLQDPQDVVVPHDNDILKDPIMLQVIALQQRSNSFHFLRFQLNTLKIDDSNPNRIKNQAWYSGPISDIDQVFRYYLDFQAYHSEVSRA